MYLELSVGSSFFKHAFWAKTNGKFLLSLMTFILFVCVQFTVVYCLKSLWHFGIMIQVMCRIRIINNVDISNIYSLDFDT